MSTYWEDRALPVLTALNEADDDRLLREGILHFNPAGGHPLRVDPSADVVYDTVLQLADAGYVEIGEISLYGGGGGSMTGVHVSGRGLQVLGEWPRFEVLTSPATLAKLLEDLGEFASPDEAGEFRTASSVVRRMSGAAVKSLALGAGGQLVRHALGLP